MQIHLVAAGIWMRFCMSHLTVWFAATIWTKTESVTALTHSHSIFTVLSHHRLLKEQDAAKLVASLEKGKSKAVVVTWMIFQHRLIRGPWFVGQKKSRWILKLMRVNRFWSVDLKPTCQYLLHVCFPFKDHFLTVNSQYFLPYFCWAGRCITLLTCFQRTKNSAEWLNFQPFFSGSTQIR